MPGADRELETFLTLVLSDSAPELAEAHWDTYPERIPEAIPLSITLLYPWVPRESLSEEHLEAVREICAARAPLTFELTRLDEFPGVVVYAVPEPDAELRDLMRTLWERFPEYPPYGKPGNDPPPHATLARLVGKDAEAVRDHVARRVGNLLPARCDVHEVTLFEEHEPDRCHVRERFSLGG